MRRMDEPSSIPNIFEWLPDAVLILGGEGQILLVNAAADGGSGEPLAAPLTTYLSRPFKPVWSHPLPRAFAVPTEPATPFPPLSAGAGCGKERV